jgi:transcription initiation factor TFIIF subunit alpha
MANLAQSSSEESDHESEERKREEERKEQEKGKGKESGKPGSGASSRGTNTPSGRGKTVDLLQKSKKRPGSPNLSDASGNESSRKKIKKTHASGTATPGGRSPTDGERSRQGSVAPSAPVRKPSAFGAGSGSDTDGTSRGPRLKLTVGKAGGSRSGTPSSSRAGSPAAQAPAAGKIGSRAGSPATSSAGPQGSTSKAPSKFPISKEVRFKNHPTGVGAQNGSLHGPSPLNSNSKPKK